MALVQFKEVADVAQRAIAIAKHHRHEIATLEHVLCALLEHSDVKKCLTAMAVNIDEMNNLMETFMKAGFIPTTTRPDPIQSTDFDALFMRVVGIARVSQRKVATTLDVLLLLTQLPHEDSYAVTALLRAGVTPLNMKKYISHGSGQLAKAGEEGFGADTAEPTNEEEAKTYLKKYATDLNQLAKDGKIDPLIGRSEEVDQIVQITARRTKNNCILVGESGVGKTAVVEGLALKIVNGEVPEILKNSTIYALDVGLLVAGAKFRGDFEERMKLVLKSLTYLPGAILFIDEMHNVMDAGSGSKGSLDVANMLKPALAKGQLRCIGSTTAEEYRKHIEKDRAMVRRFKKVNIEEPTPEVTKAILRGLKDAYESFHGVSYTEAAIDAAVDLTHKYVTSALLPDKAIDIMDNAGARQRILPEELRNKIIDAFEIEEEVSKITKIPARDIAESEESVMLRLEDELKAEVFGQNEAVEILVDSVFVSRAGLRDVNKPAGNYLFIGPTGVGKAQPLYSKIMTPTGWTEMGKISVGDLVSIPNGGSATVTGIFPQGKKPIYRVTFVDGRQADCCDEHLWKVYNKHWETEKIIPLSEIRRLLSLKEDYYIPLAKPVEFDVVDLPLDPYFVGAMLGDGNYSGKIIRFSNVDEEILDRVKNALPEGSSLKQYDCNSDCDWNVLGQQFLWPLLETAGLDKGSLSDIKFVPKLYMNGSVEQRFELLRGLMDTDGTVTKTGVISFSTSSIQLAMDVMEIVRSVGGICKLSNKWPTYMYNGEKRNGKEIYRLAIRHPEPKKMFHLSRKKERISDTYQYADCLKLKISKVELVGCYEAQCVMVDHNDHLYITDDYVVTHNTEMARQLAKSLGIPLIKFDMSEYMEKHSVSKFIGSPPGYVGFGEGGAGNGILINAIDTNPSCVLLLDEIEKAHEDIFNVLLQVMDDARLTSSGGKTVNFRNVIIIMTSNAGISAFEKSPLGFALQAQTDVDEKAIKNLFKPEFRNRLDSTVKFNRLKPENMVLIVEKFISALALLSADRGVKIAITDGAKEWLAKEGYDSAMGARPLARVINDNIKKPLSRLMILGALKEGGVANIAVEHDEIVVSGNPC